jgi:hypothetical protein
VFDGNECITIPGKSDVVIDGIIREGPHIENIGAIFIEWEQNRIPAIRIAFCLKTHVLGILPFELGVVVPTHSEYVRQSPSEQHIPPGKLVLGRGDIRTLDEGAGWCSLWLREK